MDAITYDQLTTIAGLTGSVWIVTQIVVRATGLTGAARDRFGPLIAAISGAAIATIAAIATNGDPVLGAINGVIAGGTAMGLHDTLTNTVGVGNYGE